MTVIAFTPVDKRGDWRAAELGQLVGALSPAPSGGARGWDVGTTETGDPQFYLLGAPPDHECILCISRLGRIYVLEDGCGQVLYEDNNLTVLAERAKALLRKKRSQMIARIAVAWCALREAFEEKLEPIMGESEELLAHVVPQLAALA
jgi:hypothetical protein